jgi:hypothetical protein
MEARPPNDDRSINMRLGLPKKTYTLSHGEREW